MFKLFCDSLLKHCIDVELRRKSGEVWYVLKIMGTSFEFSEAAEMGEPCWERNLEHGLAVLGRNVEEVETRKKSECWKVALTQALAGVECLASGAASNEDAKLRYQLCQPRS
jgi:hypothetical protein